LRAQEGAGEAAGEGGFADAARADEHERVVQLAAREGPSERCLGAGVAADAREAGEVRSEARGTREAGGGGVHAARA